jgi:HK97 family phage major capsid protein
MENIAAMIEEQNKAFTNYVGNINGRVDAIERAVAIAQNPATGPAPSSGPFSSLGEQLQAVAQAGTPGGKVDERLYKVQAAATGANEGVASEGGFLVQQDFVNQLGSPFQAGQLAKLCRKIQLTRDSNTLKLNAFDETSRVTGSRFGGVRGYWVPEAGEITSSKPAFRQLTLELKKLCGLFYATDELLMDSSALQAAANAAFNQELGFLIDDAIINGTGAGMPLGILNAGCTVSVAKESGQAAATIVYENIVKMWSRLLPGSEAKAVWLVNKNSIPQLFTMTLAVGTGGQAVYQPANAAAGQPYQTLFGRPVLPIEQAATLGTVGDIILADLSNGYILAEKGGVRYDASIHVRFQYAESVFRFMVRVDGQPFLASPVTPFKGGAGSTQSHFVTLATRA